MKCNDGSYCNRIEEGWTCCNNNGGRAKCPKNFPDMCLEKKCANNMAHCCSQSHCEGMGGKRLCPGK